MSPVKLGGGVGLALALAALGCGVAPGGGAMDATVAATVDQGTDPFIPAPDDAPYATMRAACAFSAGARAEQTFGPSIAGAVIPIDTFVILVKENRSFDHYFSSLPAYGQPDVDVAAPDAHIPDANGAPVSRFPTPTLCTNDVAHGWSGMHADWNGGQMDGFVRQNGNSDPMAYYQAADIPFYYALATTFGIADRYFSPSLGSTGPNRYYLYAGTSAGVIDNKVTLPAATPNLFDALSAAGVRWRVYAGIQVNSPNNMFSFEWGAFPHLLGRYPDNFKHLPDFTADAAAGTLPQVVFLRLNCGDEHPPEDVQIGQWNTRTVFDTLASSPQWPSTALFVTWDEGGGYYDHVPPPTACPPDGIAPMLGPNDAPGDFARYGFRVPLLVASPWSRPHYVSHTTFDHTALLRLLELKYHLPAFGGRDANAGSLLEFFDFQAPHFVTVPSLPQKSIDAARKCNYPPDAVCVAP